MSERYDQIMERIVVTDDMRRRILLQVDQQAQEPAPKVLTFPHWRRYVGLAACLLLLLTGLYFLPRPAEPERPPLLATPHTTLRDNLPGVAAPRPAPAPGEAASLAELEALVGFPVEPRLSLPFAILETRYSVLEGATAVVTYSGDTGEAQYRKSAAGTLAAPAGFPDRTTLEADGRTVQLLGEGGAYSMALWEEDAFSCSLFLPESCKEDDWRQILAPVS